MSIFFPNRKVIHFHEKFSSHIFLSFFLLRLHRVLPLFYFLSPLPTKISSICLFRKWILNSRTNSPKINKPEKLSYSTETYLFSPSLSSLSFLLQTHTPTLTLTHTHTHTLSPISHQLNINVGILIKFNANVYLV